MDPLSDVLRVVRLSGAFFYRVEATSPWSVCAPSSEAVRTEVLDGPEHLMSYHILTSGRCFGGFPGAPPIEMQAGDVLVFPHGDPHYMGSEAGRMVNTDRFGVTPGRYPETVHLGESGAPDATFVCGFLGCDRQPFNPLLASLPRWIHARGLREGWVRMFADQVVEESQRGSSGSAAALARLAELMVIEVLRHHVATLPSGQTGWLAGLTDPVVGGALSRLHADPARPWTLEGLATEVAVSRSSLAERFVRLVGQPPMQYLAAWRMQVAAGMLAPGSVKVASIAAAVGYDSESAFSRAFKRATGLAPGSWRSRRAPPAALTAV